MSFPAHLLVSGRTVLLRHIFRLTCLGVIALNSVDLAAAPPPPVQPVPEAALLALAQKKFGTLSRAEEELFRAAQEGRPASALSKDEKENDLAKAANWPADRVVRAECIAWVCTDPRASALVTHRGLNLWGMRIDGELDLSNAEIKFQLLASKCAFSENISLQDAQLRGFYLPGCKIKGLNASRTTINGAVFLRGEGFKAEGEVNLAGATIGGNLDCDGAQFLNAKGRALNASGAKIEGDVFLRNGFRAEGEVRLVGVTIGGDLSGVGGQFSNAEGRALNAGGAKIEGFVYFRRGFMAEGEVRLVATTIGGDLDCGGGQFSNTKGLALNASTANIQGGVYLRSGFRAEGEVSWVAAIVGNLQILRVVEPKHMILDLRLAKVGTFWDDEKSWPVAGNLSLDGFRYERLDEASPFEADSRKKWLGLQSRDKFRPQPYEQLAAVLRQMGHEGEARQVMIEKNRERARFTHFLQPGWWWYDVFGRFIGYGYAPWRAFAASLVMILLGTLLFRLGSAHGLISPASDKAYAKAPNGQEIEENERKKISEEYPVFNAFVYSFESFVPLLKLDQSVNWRPNANHGGQISLFRSWSPRTGSLLRGYLYFHIASGWLLTSLWVGAITGLVKT